MFAFIKNMWYSLWDMNFIPDEIYRLRNGMNEVVPVIASFDGAGNVQPLYVRIKGKTYKITGCQMRTLRTFNIFRCSVINNHHEEHFTLVYHKQESAWTLETQSTVLKEFSR